MKNRILVRIANDNIDPVIEKELNQLLSKIRESSVALKDIYYSLFDNLNALYDSYPSVYKTLQTVVKLPTNEDAMNTVSFNNDLNQALERFKDRAYLASHIGNQSETI